MFVVLVHIHVKPECVEAFKTATEENSRCSLQEAGIARFDMLQEQEDPTRFVLVEAYRHRDAPGAHKETAHYRAWRDAVEPMMAEPRRSVRTDSVCPPDETW